MYVYADEPERSCADEYPTLALVSSVYQRRRCHCVLSHELSLSKVVSKAYGTVY